MGVWLKNITGATPLWVTAAESHAKGSFETACESYRKALDNLPPGHDRDGPVMDFIVNKVRIMYMYCTYTCIMHLLYMYIHVHVHVLAFMTFVILNTVIPSLLVFSFSPSIPSLSLPLFSLSSPSLIPSFSLSNSFFQVSECYCNLGEWKEVENWHHKTSVQSQQYSELGQSYTGSNVDVHKIQLVLYMYMYMYMYNE